jgi:2-oxo-4-hydroxy-4-carboxy-5-ureidoimidazoline decarboxylase
VTAEAAGLPTLATLNRLPVDAFVGSLEGVFEHAPWLVQRVAAARPFASVDALHRALMAVLRGLPEPELLALLRGHPELAGEQARRGGMTADSVAEQGGLALGEVAGDEAARWDALNAAYRERFGFPFMLCIRRHGRASALRAFEARLRNDRLLEIANALDEIGRISRLRLASRVAGHGLPDLHGGLLLSVSPALAARCESGWTLQWAEADALRPTTQWLDTWHGSGAAEVWLRRGEPLRQGDYRLNWSGGGDADAVFALTRSEATHRVLATWRDGRPGLSVELHAD